MKKLVLIILLLGIFISSCYNTNDYGITKKQSGELKGKPGSLACDFIENKTEQGWCYQTIAEKRKDYQICSNIKETEIRDLCYYGIARELKNHSMCNLITNISDEAFYEDYYSYYDCFLSIGKDTNSFEVCNDIKVQEIRDRCYFSMASYLEAEEIKKESKKPVEKIEIYNCLATCFDHNYTYGILLENSEKSDCKAIAKDYYGNVNVEDKRYFFGYTPQNQGCCCYNVKFYDAQEENIEDSNNLEKQESAPLLIPYEPEPVKTEKIYIDREGNTYQEKPKNYDCINPNCITYDDYENRVYCKADLPGC